MADRLDRWKQNRDSLWEVTMLRSIVFTLLLALAAASPALSQAELSPGDRVRLAESDGERLTGTVSDISSDWITIRSDEGTEEWLVPTANLGSLERSTGSQRRFARNFGITVGISAATLGIVSALAWSPCRATGFMACFMTPGSRGEAFAWGVGGGAVIGIPIGVLVGLAVGSEGWESVSLPGAEGARVSISPILGPRLGAAASIAVGGH